MIVMAGTITNGTTINEGVIGTLDDLPAWVYDKIYNTFSNIVEVKSVSCRATDWSSQNMTVALNKSTKLRLYNSSALTLSADRGFRISFDLLIDNE